MAGTPKYDRTEVLLQAAREFADRGYDGTSISHLVEATGLLRGSLYGAFGSKSEVFRLAFHEATAAVTPDVDLVLDLTVVALRERAGQDATVADRATGVLASLDASGVPASQQIYQRLLARAQVRVDPAGSSSIPTHRNLKEKQWPT